MASSVSLSTGTGIDWLLMSGPSNHSNDRHSNDRRSEPSRSDSAPGKFSRGCPRPPRTCAYLRNLIVATPMRDRKTARIALFADGTPLERAVAAKLIGDMNLLRLKASARFLARGLAPDI